MCNTKMILIIVAGTLGLVAAGCNKEAKPAGAHGAKTAAASVVKPAAAPAVKLAPAPASGKQAGLMGKVAQTMDSGGYTYVELETAEGKKWAAVRKAELKVGQEVLVAGATLMQDFTSKTLDRTFKEIYFGQLGVASDAVTASTTTKPAAPTEGAMGNAGKAPSGHGNMVHGQGDKAAATGSGVKKQPQMDVGDALEKAPGPEGRTVAEIFGQAQGLKDKTVTLRGKVVKINRGIMGSNWVHFQDGSGSVETGDHDLTVTTKEDAKLGEVLLVKGVMRTNKDFGAGYKYAVIMEDAVFNR